MQVFYSYWWNCLCCVVILDITVHSAPSVQGNEQHAIEKRSEFHIETDFMQKSYLVEEGAGTLEDTVCVKGGGLGRRSFRLFSTIASPNRCSRGPCPNATENVDFVKVYVDQFWISPGELLCFDVTILEDDAVEGREVFIVGLTDLRWGEVLTTASVTIEDNDGPRLVSNRAGVLESVGTVQVCVRGGVTALPLIVQVTNTLDLQEMMVMFTLAPDELRCVDIQVVDDLLYERNEVAEVSVRSANILLGNFSESFLITIIDNDPTPQFEQAQYTVNEGAGELEVCVVFASDPSDSVSSTLVSNDESAKGGIDFIGTDDSFLINGGERKCISFIIIEDDLPETVKSFTVSLNSSNSELAEPLRVRVIIQDNDVIEFEQSAYTSLEAGSGVEVCVTLPGKTNETMSGLLFTSSGTATERLDFFPLRVTFNISGSQRECFFVYNYRDNIAEFQEEFTISVYTLHNPQFAIDVRVARIIVVDDDSKLCDNLTEPMNGQIVTFTDVNMPGSEAVYGCAFGFQLIGLSGNSRTCLPSGEWTGNDPSCATILCPVLQAPGNGRVAVSSRTVFSLAMYSCNNGYVIEGDSERLCLVFNGGIWSGDNPTCKLIVCPLLSSPTNGRVLLPEVRTPGSVASYSCSDRLSLTGDKVRVCGDNGTWNGTEPTCLEPQFLGPPVTMKLVGNTPRVTGNSMTVKFVVSGPVTRVICTLNNKVIEEDFISRSNGGMTFTHLSPGEYNMKIVVMDLENNKRAQVNRFFEIGVQPYFCGLHLINEGIVIDRHSLWVQFAAVPEFESYWCQLDAELGFDCGSPVRRSGLRPGHHHLKITHYGYRDVCDYRRSLNLDFEVQDTPDNPYNNL